jgi:putative transposase
MDPRNVFKNALLRLAEGYGAFSVAISGVEATITCIRKQAELHRTRSFREEFVTILRRQDFDYDESIQD